MLDPPGRAWSRISAKCRFSRAAASSAGDATSIPAAAMTDRPSAVARSSTSAADCPNGPSTTSAALPRLASSLAYFHRITTSLTGTSNRP